MKKLVKDQNSTVKDQISSITSLTAGQEMHAMQIEAQKEKYNRQVADILDEMQSAAQDDQDTARAKGVADGKAMQKKKVAAVTADNRRLSRELVVSQAQTASVHANTPALLAEAAAQGAKKQEGKTNEVLNQLNKVEAEKEKAKFENEKLKKMDKLNKAVIKDAKQRAAILEAEYNNEIKRLEDTLATQLTKLLEYKNSNEKEEVQHNFRDMAEFFLPPLVFKSYDEKHKLDQLGARAKSFNSMGGKSKVKRRMGQLVSFMVSEVLEASLANFDDDEKDYAELMKVVKELRTTKGSPIGIALEGIVAAEVAKNVIDHEGLAQSYIALSKSKEKVSSFSWYLFLSLFIYF